MKQVRTKTNQAKPKYKHANYMRCFWTDHGSSKVKCVGSMACFVYRKVKWHTVKYGEPYSEFVLCNYPKCTHTAVNTHPEQWVYIYAAAPRGSAVGGSVPCSRSPQSWYWGWKRALYIHSPHLQFLPARDLPTFWLWVWLSNH